MVCNNTFGLMIIILDLQVVVIGGPRLGEAWKALLGPMVALLGEAIGAHSGTFRPIGGLL